MSYSKLVYPRKMENVLHTVIFDLYLLRGVRVEHVNAVLPQAGRVAVWVEVDEDAVAAYNRFKAAHGICDVMEKSTGQHPRDSPVVMLIIKFDGPVCCFTHGDMAAVLARFRRRFPDVVVVKDDYTISGANVTAYLRVRPRHSTKCDQNARREEAKELAEDIANSSNPAFRGQTINLTMGTATLHAYQVSTKPDVYPSRKGKTVRGVPVMPCPTCMLAPVAPVPVMPAAPVVPVPVVTTHDPYYVPDAACVVEGHGTVQTTQAQVVSAPPQVGEEVFGELYTPSLWGVFR